MQICIFWDSISASAQHPFSVLVQTESCKSRFFHHRLSQHPLPGVFHGPQLIYFPPNCISIHISQGISKQSITEIIFSFSECLVRRPSHLPGWGAGCRGEGVGILAQRPGSVSRCGPEEEPITEPSVFVRTCVVFGVCLSGETREAALGPAGGNAWLWRALNVFQAIGETGWLLNGAEIERNPCLPVG